MRSKRRSEIAAPVQIFLRSSKRQMPAARLTLILENLQKSLGFRSRVRRCDRFKTTGNAVFPGQIHCSRQLGSPVKLAGSNVHSEYDIFEIMPDGAPLWREAIHGQENAIRKSQILAAKTPNEIRVMHVPTKTVIAAMNVPESS
jgi:hypothetical protein